MVRHRFDGEIAGFATTSGHRFVVGRWPVSPFGPFADVMVEGPDGVRTLLAPDERIADFVGATYSFDRVQVTPVGAVREPAVLHVRAGDLDARLVIGPRSWVGRALLIVPRGISRTTAWATLVDPVARIALAGVRTRGQTADGRREWYGAWDVHRLAAATTTWAGDALGPMTDVTPPVRFGFGSTPRQPSLTALRSTIDVPDR
jgi:hypothetical protein